MHLLIISYVFYKYTLYFNKTSVCFLICSHFNLLLIQTQHFLYIYTNSTAKFPSVQQQLCPDFPHLSTCPRRFLMSQTNRRNSCLNVCFKTIQAADAEHHQPKVSTIFLQNPSVFRTVQSVLVVTQKAKPYMHLYLLAYCTLAVSHRANGRHRGCVCVTSD